MAKLHALGKGLSDLNAYNYTQLILFFPIIRRDLFG